MAFVRRGATRDMEGTIYLNKIRKPLASKLRSQWSRLRE
ncbi:hypothetical protein PANO111632_13585 [Paracoccus nototheniae]